jgi:two-component system, chemotaxis family, sensor kinase CheA
MPSKDQELLQKLLATFKLEAEDHIRSISSGLARLEKSSSPEEQMATIEGMFREAHSLKGAARAVNLGSVETTCQNLENLFARLKGKDLSVSVDLINALYGAIDGLSTTLSDAGLAAKTKQERSPQTPMVDTSSVPGTIHGAPLPSPSPPAAEAAAGGLMGDLPLSAETLRVSTLKLDVLFRQTEELIPARAIIGQRVSECRELQQIVTQWEKQWRAAGPLTRSRRHLQSSPRRGPQSNGIERILDLNEKTLASVSTKLAALGKNLSSDQRWLERRIDDLMEDVKQISMVPFSALLETFPRLVRDLCRDCGKDAELVITGVDIEADRRVLEQIKDPLIHLVRNSMDHGIEAPKVRLARSKPSRATISITIVPKDGDKVEITVSDDGAGIDFGKVRAAAVKSGRVSPEGAHKMDEEQALSFVFESGVSTSPIITEVSGRGLGLAIVREKAERVGGTVAVETQSGIGTSFRLTLPLTLAKFRGVVVRVGDHHFVLPMLQVQRVLRVGPEEIKPAENRETIQFENRVISAVRLAGVLDIAQQNTASDAERKVPALVLRWAGEQVAFLVDEILNEQEVLVKNLGRQLPNVRHIAGATILGTGKVLPVLNVADLFRSAASISARTAQKHESVPKSVLVAEDSITARALLKNILESAGYRVKTAVDGADALDLLGHEGFDLLVSDVDMPRMNGFDLIAKVRGDKKLAHLPVVLVTALDSREDLERGVDVGANAYIVKGSFDQSNLLDVVHRLI